MARRSGLVDRLLHRRSVARWRRALANVGQASLERLRQQRTQARELSHVLEEHARLAEERLILPRIGNNNFQRPRGTDWAWRPALWRGPIARRGLAAASSPVTMGGDVSLFHDCRSSELTLRQIRNVREQDLAPFGLQMDVFQFDGSFLSIVIDLPPESCVGLRTKHLIRIDPLVEVEKPIEIFARLNIQHGPNVEKIVRELPASGDRAVEFDLAYVKLNEKRIEKMWLDLIFEGPEMNLVTIRDITMCRYPRAEL